MATQLAPTFYRPTLHGPSRTFCPVTDGSRIFLPGWPVKDLFVFTGSAVNLVARVSASAPEDGQGFIASGIDSSGFLWLLGADGSCYGLSAASVPSSGAAVTLSLIAKLPTDEYVDGVANATSAGFYVVGSAGDLYHVTTSANSKLGSFGSLARGLCLNQGKIYAALPNLGEVGIFTLSGPTSATQTVPIPNPSFCETFSGGTWVAGSSPASLTAVADGVSYGSATGAAVSGTTLSYITGTDPNFTVTDSITLDYTPISFVFLSTLSQIAVISSSNLYIYSIENSKITLSQTLANSGSYQITANSSEDKLFVTTGANNSISVFSENVGTWSSDTDIDASGSDYIWVGETDISTAASPTIVIGSASSFTVLQPSGSSWASYFTGTVTGSIVGIIGDGTNTLILSYDSTSGTSYVSMIDFDNKNIVETFDITGEIVSGVSIEKYNFAFLTKYVSSSNPAKITILRALDDTLTLLGTSEVTGDPAVISWTGYSLWVGGNQYQLTGSGLVEPVTNGYAALITSSTTSSYDLGLLNVPAAVAIGATKAVVVCANNNVFVFPLAGGSSTDYELAVFSGQRTNTPLNLSGLIIQSSSAVLSTSASGEVAVINEVW